MTTVRVIDVGGNGFRRADVIDGKIGPIKINVNPSRNLKDLLDLALIDLAPGTEGIAYALAGLVKDHDLVVNAPNGHFLDGVKLASETRNKGSIRCYVLNDMEAAVYGMASEFSDEPYFMGITWSSGIGLRIWKNGGILSDAEGGHMVVDPSPFAPLCGCGKRGHLEAIAGGEALKRRVLAETQAIDIKIPDGKHPCQFLQDSYKEREFWACEIYGLVSRCMAIFLANIQSLYFLPLVVWKGTVARKILRILAADIRAEMAKMLIDPSWATPENLGFVFGPSDNEDSFLGGYHYFEICKD